MEREREREMDKRAKDIEGALFADMSTAMLDLEPLKNSDFFSATDRTATRISN